MKKIIKNKAMLIALVILSSLAILSCGGGGGGDTPETNTTLTAANSPQAAAGVLKAMDIADALQGLSGLMTTTSSSTTASSSTSPISNILTITGTALQNSQQQTQSSLANSMYSHSMQCDNVGGTMVISDFTWDGFNPLNPPDPEDVDWETLNNFKGDVTFTNCKKSTLTLNGSVNVSVTGLLSAPSAVTMSGSLNYNEDIADTTNDTTIILSNANLAISGIGTDFDMGNATIVLTGSVQATVDGENISFRGNGFTVKMKSITGGSEVRLSGQIRTACLDTWLTITTVEGTPVKIMTVDTCPTGGDVSASYNGNTVRAVIAAGTTNISLYFNGTLLGGPTYTYTNCTDLKGECP